MSLITLSNLKKEYGTHTVLNGINLRVAHGEKIGIVGKNGGGKTTLMRLILKQEEPDSGSVSVSRGVRIGYLAQVNRLNTDQTVLAEARTILREVEEIEVRLREAEAYLAEHSKDDQTEDAMEAYASARDRFDFAGGDAAEQNLMAALTAMGFSDSDLQKHVSVLSGGERTRLAMAKLLASAPDILLLDEPTNHLDIRAVEWLEGFLTRFPGAVLVVSHDRRFLQNVAQTLWEVEAASINVYKGGFAAYRTQRAANRARQAEEYARQQAYISRTEEFIRRNIAGQNTRMAQGRRKILNRTERLERPTEEPNKMIARINSSGRSGQSVVVAEHARKAYGEKFLLRDASFVLYRGDRVGLVGPNGVGKTTLVEMLLGEEVLDAGYLRTGPSVTTAYHKQEQDDFEPDEVVLEAFYDRAGMTIGEARSHLARFLFTEDEVFKNISALSGGERAKLAMSLMVLSPANLLILDEPTNHLDVFSCDALTESLKQYDGTLLLISHDRELLDTVTNKTLILHGDGKFTLRTGNYSQTNDVEWLAGEPFAKPIASTLPTKASRQPAAIIASINTTPQSSHALSKEKQKLKKRVETIEAEIEKYEAELATIEAILAAPDPTQDIIALSQTYAKVQEELNNALAQWETSLGELETLEAQ